MKKDFFLKIWKDSVWSKVISVIIVAILTLLYNLLLSRMNDISFTASFVKFWTYKIDVWIFALSLTVLFIMYLLLANRFKYDTDTLALDRALFNQIRNAHSMPDFIQEIKSNGFSSRPVKYDRISTLTNFVMDSEKPDFEFVNPYLNKLKNKLIKEFVALDSVLNGNIYGKRDGEWLAIPAEWEYDQPDRMAKAVEDIEKQENILTSTFQEFISNGRKILKV